MGASSVLAGFLISVSIILDSIEKGPPVSVDLFILRLIGFGIAFMLIFAGIKVINPAFEDTICR